MHGWLGFNGINMTEAMLTITLTVSNNIYYINDSFQQRRTLSHMYTIIINTYSSFGDIYSNEMNKCRVINKIIHHNRQVVC